MSYSNLFWRRLAYAGARYGPRFWVRYSPSVFGLAFAAALPEQRERVRQNLRLVHGPRGRVSENLDVARTFVEFAHCLTESLASERPEAKAATRRVTGADTLRKVLDEGRGAIVVTIHSGAWDIAAQLLSVDYAVDVLVVMQAEADAGARDLHDEIRNRGGVRIAHVGEHALDSLPLLNQLKQGGVVAVQLDRLPLNAHHLDTQLFGRPFPMPRGPFHLASVARAPIVPMFIRRSGYFEYDVDIRPPIGVPPHGTMDDQLEAARTAARDVERFLGDNATQWFHFPRVGG